MAREMQPLVLPVTIRHCAGMSEFFTSPLILVKNLHYVYSLTCKIQVEFTLCSVKHRAIKTYEHWKYTYRDTRVGTFRCGI